MELLSIWEYLGYLMAVGIGLGCGSYATMPYYRLPTGEACAGKWIGDKSHCVSCNHILRTRDLVPVFNWLLTRGKCQFCSFKINPVYFFIEFSVMVLSVIIYHRFGYNNLDYYIIVLGLSTCLVIMAATDFTYRKIPDQLFVVAIMFGFLYQGPEQFFDMIQVITAAILLDIIWLALYRKFKGKDPESYRYCKFMVLAAVWLQYKYFFIFLAVVGAISLLLYFAAKIFKWEKSPAYAFVLTATLITFILCNLPEIAS